MTEDIDIEIIKEELPDADYTARKLYKEELNKENDESVNNSTKTNEESTIPPECTDNKYTIDLNIYNEPEPQFTCEFCDERFLLKHNLYDHKRICDQKYHLINTFAKDYLEKQSDNVYTCKYCQKTYKHISSLQKHLAYHSNIRYECDICHQKFVIKYDLKLHKFRHSVTKPFVCEVCNKSFYQKRNLDRHSQLHAGANFYCALCNKAFFRQTSLNSHMRDRHSDSRPYCEKCKSYYASSAYLKQHLLLHAESAKFTCERCHKSFTDDKRLQRHLLNHSEVRQFKCDVCGREFKQKATLTRHVEIHEGVRHTCDVCEQSFSQKATLNRHVAMNHPKTEID